MSKKRAVKRRDKRNARPPQHVWMARVAHARKMRHLAMKQEQAAAELQAAA